MSDNLSTREMILKVAEQEFLEKGFEGASLRVIVKKSGVTTGAFYGYYKSKEQLFDALVKDVADIYISRFSEVQREFADMPPETQKESMGEYSGECMLDMIDFVYENFNTFKLIICCSSGTRYQNFIHNLVEIEADSTHKFIETMGNIGHQIKPIDSDLEHILISGLFSGFFEMVVHDMPREKAHNYIKGLREFYIAGWTKIMEL